MGGRVEQQEQEEQEMEQESGPGAGSGRKRMLARGVNALHMWFPWVLCNPRREEGTLQQEPALQDNKRFKNICLFQNVGHK